MDSYNHTGYAQVFVETRDTSPEPQVTAFTIGDDIITQATYNGTTSVSKHLLYDGHGSTRQLVDASEGITDYYSYDAYGVMLGGNPAQGSSPATSLLYAGEQFDTDMQQYYLRARYYDPLNGRFNRMDPHPGNNQDPQSLHKYLYCHANPVNAIDPSGRYALFVNAILVIAVFIGGFLFGRFLKSMYHRFQGLQSSRIKDKDIKAALRGYQYAVEQIPEILPKNPKSWEEWHTMLS